MTTEDDSTRIAPDREEDVYALSPGYELRSYTIESELGAGGFGITYLARHRYLEDQWAAIKEYLPEGIAMRDARSRVLNSEDSNSVMRGVASQRGCL